MRERDAGERMPAAAAVVVGLLTAVGIGCSVAWLCWAVWSVTGW